MLICQRCVKNTETKEKRAFAQKSGKRRAAVARQAVHRSAQQTACLYAVYNYLHSRKHTGLQAGERHPKKRAFRASGASKATNMSRQARVKRHFVGNGSRCRFRRACRAKVSVRRARSGAFFRRAPPLQSASASFPRLFCFLPSHRLSGHPDM